MSPVLKYLLFIGGGALIGAALGYAGRCAGNS